jgi:hypothetical protein
MKKIVFLHDNYNFNYHIKISYVIFLNKSKNTKKIKLDT